MGSPYLRKCVALGQGGIIGDTPSQSFQNNSAFFVDTGTQYARLWADWPTLQPSSDPNLLGVKPGPFDILDSQVQAANAIGISPVITIWRCPTWASGVTTNEPGTNKPPQRHTPAAVDANSPYIKFVGHLLTRYAGAAWSGSQGTALAIELCNEPNYEMWPLYTSTGSDNISCVVAQMISNAQAKHDGLGLSFPLLFAPGTSDSTANSASVMPYNTFTSNLLGILMDTLAFRPGNWIGWSHHNYNDIEGGLWGASRTQVVRSKLIAKGWTGTSGAPGEQPPLIYLTEGGARLNAIPPPATTNQAVAILTARDRLKNYADGNGVAMFSNYLFYSSPTFDSGLRDPFVSMTGGAARPAYTSVWKPMPSW